MTLDKSFTIFELQFSSRVLGALNDLADVKKGETGRVFPFSELTAISVNLLP